jgi:ketosteroid isomerase-like protein
VADGNLDTVREVYRAWNGPGGMADSLHLFHEEVEYVNPDNAIDAGTRHGHDGIRQVVRSLDGAFAEHTHELHELIEAGDKVLAHTTFKACGRDSGAWVEVPEQHVWMLRDGKIVRLAWFHDEGAARRAAGLSRTGARPR